MTRFAPQTKIPAIYMRGGTSKGLFFRLQDLPAAAQQPGPVRDAVLLRAMGASTRTASRSTAWATHRPAPARLSS